MEKRKQWTTGMIAIPVCYIPCDEDDTVIYDKEYMRYLFERELEKLKDKN
jgi:hypothetical protein